MNNLELYRKSIKEYFPSEQIDNLEQFKQLVNHLCDNKLLHPEEVKKLISKISNSKETTFPINFQQLEQFIMTSFADPKCQQMLAELKNIKQKLRQTKGILAIWKDKGLSKKERYELESIFQRGNSKLKEFYQLLHKEKEAMEQISQQELQMIDSLNEWIKMQKIEQPFKDYEEYQNHHQKLIDQIFNKIRVRQVHFKQRKNTSKVSKIQTVVGLDSRNDQPVEVTLIPKRNLEFDVLNYQLITFNARKQLMLSSHFSRFLGYNTHADSHCFFYFNEYIQGENLQQFISSTSYQFDEQTPLLKYWVYLIYKCFYDIYLMCSYVPQLPIRLDDFEIGSCGLKLILKNAKFVQSRQDSQVQFYEAQLLQNLGSLILKLINIEPSQWPNQTKIKKIQNKSIINCLLNARAGQRNVKEGRVNIFINFFNIQTHPLFQSCNFLMGQTVIQNFYAIKKYK